MGIRLKSAGEPQIPMSRNGSRRAGDAAADSVSIDNAAEFTRQPANTQATPTTEGFTLTLYDAACRKLAGLIFQKLFLKQDRGVLQ